MSLPPPNRSIVSSLNSALYRYTRWPGLSRNHSRRRLSVKFVPLFVNSTISVSSHLLNLSLLLPCQSLDRFRFRSSRCHHSQSPRNHLQLFRRFSNSLPLPRPVENLVPHQLEEGYTPPQIAPERPPGCRTGQELGWSGSLRAEASQLR